MHGCKFTSRQYLDTKDKASTGNMLKHIKKCWGNKAWMAASECHNAAQARSIVTQLTPSLGSITTSFSQKGKGKVLYSHLVRDEVSK